MTPEQMIKINRKQVADAEAEQTALEQASRALIQAEEHVKQARVRAKSAGVNWLAQEARVRAAVAEAMKAIDDAGLTPYIKRVATDPWGWRCVSDPDLAERIYTDDAPVAVGDDPAPAWTVHAPGEIRHKSYRFPVPVDDSLPDRTFRAVITTEQMDRDGEVLLSDGMEWEAFSHNPRLLLQHDRDQHIGRVLELDRTDDGWLMLAEIKRKPEWYDVEQYGPWIGDLVWEQVKTGELSTVSVGFLGLEHHREESEDGLHTYVVYDRWELVEVSLVDIPSNRGARVTGVGGGQNLVSGSAA